MFYVLGGDGIACDKLRKSGFKVHALPGLKRDLSPLSDLLSLLQLIWLIMKEKLFIKSFSKEHLLLIDYPITLAFYFVHLIYLSTSYSP